MSQNLRIHASVQKANIRIPAGRAKITKTLRMGAALAAVLTLTGANLLNNASAQLFPAKPSSAEAKSVPQQASAGGAIVLVGVPVGRSYYQFDNDGSTIVGTPIPVVSVGGTPPVVVTPPTNPPSNPPTNPPTPTPDGLDGLAAASARGAIAVGKPNEAAIMAAFITGIRQSIADGDLKLTQVAAKQAEIMDVAYQVIGNNARERWTVWADQINPEIVKRNALSKDQFLTLYGDLIKGLNRAAEGSNEAINPARILRLVMAVISQDYLEIAKIVAEIVRERQGG